MPQPRASSSGIAYGAVTVSRLCGLRLRACRVLPGDFVAAEQEYKVFCCCHRQLPVVPVQQRSSGAHHP